MFNHVRHNQENDFFFFFLSLRRWLNMNTIRVVWNWFQQHQDITKIEFPYMSRLSLHSDQANLHLINSTSAAHPHSMSQSLHRRRQRKSPHPQSPPSNVFWLSRTEGLLWILQFHPQRKRPTSDCIYQHVIRPAIRKPPPVDSVCMKASNYYDCTLWWKMFTSHSNSRMKSSHLRSSSYFCDTFFSQGNKSSLLFTLTAWFILRNIIFNILICLRRAKKRIQPRDPATPKPSARRCR